MPFDGLFAAAVRAQLSDVLAEARIDKIYQPTPYTIILHVRRPGDSRRLLLSADPRHARVHLTDTSPPNPLQAPAFCMLLRKYLDPGKIVAVEQVGLDRILHVVIDTFDDIGRPVRRRLVAELTGRNSNIILVDESSNKIIDAIRRASLRVNRYRAMLPGEEYVPPPPTGKSDPRTWQLDSIHDETARWPAAETVVRALVASFDGISPFAAEHIIAAAGLPTELRVEQLTDVQCDELSSALHALGAAAAAESFSPTIIVDDEGRPLDFWAFPPRHVAADRHRIMGDAGDPSAAVDAVYSRRLSDAAEGELRRKLQRTLSTARKRLARKAAALQSDLDDAARADEYRVFGELLTANLHMVQQGSEATVPDYYSGGTPVTIPLDPSLHPAANAQRYFKRYNKAKTARRLVREQLDATTAELDYLDQALVHVEMASGIAELHDIEAELAAAGLLPAPKERGARAGGRGSRRRRLPASKPIEAETSDGSRVLVGRNNRQNDQLSLRTARPDDIWLHAKDMPGAHVILQPADAAAEPDMDTVREAAEVAAYFSKGRQSSNVPVDWTRARHVRKPRGARPGMVIYDHHQTIYVTPNDHGIQRLLGDDGESQP